jgi:4-diphosphocytidyl-2-C-methyl-D-erythritol kinase
MARTEAFAPAKVNLCLHVTGRRADGYHLLDSLVVFAGVGDRVTAETADGLSLAVTGPQAGALGAAADNLVLRAARAFGAAAGAGTLADAGTRARLTLHKALPVAAGLGGGSADAAAALVALAALWRRPLPDAAAVMALGADVPVCLAGRPARLRGAGEDVAALDAPLPPAWLVLANPGAALATPAVFAALDRRDNPGLPARLPPFPDAAALAAFLAAQRNDLEDPAERLLPAVGTVRAALARQPGALVARMSGSGATCFALFPAAAPAQAAAAALARAEPGWWVAAAPVLP